MVGFVGEGGTLEFTGINGGETGGTLLLSLDYINADVTSTNTACSNCRNAFMSVNGGAAVQVQMPLSSSLVSTQSFIINQPLLQGFFVFERC